MTHARTRRTPSTRLVIPDVSEQRFDCQSCTRCCRDLVVHLTAADRDRLDRQGWAKELRQSPYVRMGGTYALAHAVDGACIFLREDGLCRIHAEHGFDEKPLACRLFPMTLEPAQGCVGGSEQDAVYVSLRYDCPSVARTTGRKLGSHRPELERMVDELEHAAPEMLRVPGGSVEWRDDRAAEAGEVAAFVGHVAAWLGDGDRSVRDRVLGVVSLLETLEGADLGRLQGEQLIELLDMLADELPSAVGEMGTPAEPSERALRLFRQAVFAHSENIAFAQATAPFFTRLSRRWGQLTRARRLMAGDGVIPALVPGTDVGTFEQIERCRPAKDMDRVACEGLILRYLRIRLLGATVFGPGYYGWPVLPGLGAMLLTLPITGWMARYLALRDGRETFGFDDVAEALGVVHRNVGRSPELGGRTARMRQNYLTQDGGISQLLAKYPCC